MTNLNPQQFFHGTRADLQIGDVLDPDMPKVHTQSEDVAYATTDERDAWWFANLSVPPGREVKHPQNVYRVEPVADDVEPDQNHVNDRFDESGGRRFQSRSGFRVVGVNSAPPGTQMSMIPDRYGRQYDPTTYDDSRVTGGSTPKPIKSRVGASTNDHQALLFVQNENWKDGVERFGTPHLAPGSAVHSEPDFWEPDRDLDAVESHRAGMFRNAVWGAKNYDVRNASR